MKLPMGSLGYNIPQFPFFLERWIFSCHEFATLQRWHVAYIAPGDVGAWSRGGSVNVNKKFGKRFRSGY